MSNLTAPLPVSFDGSISPTVRNAMKRTESEVISQNGTLGTDQLRREYFMALRDWAGRNADALEGGETGAQTARSDR